MRIVHFEKSGVPGIAVDDGSGWHGLTARESGFPGTLPELIAQGADLLRAGKDLLPKHAIDLNTVRILPSGNAKVFVYIGQTLIRAYYVPKDQTGNVWTVFAVSEDGDLQDINKFSGVSVPDASALTAEMLFGAKFETADRVAGYRPSPSVAVSATAKRENTQGEAAYRSDDYAAAIRLFQMAIEADSSYGQAYSNLGLVFQKSGRVAEALWANRKAIALAEGPQAANTRANTHFNNGKIYENAQQWTDALREYQAAQAEKSNPTYDNAVQRMRGHGVH